MRLDVALCIFLAGALFGALLAGLAVALGRDLAARADAPQESDPLEGLPPDLAAVLRDQSVIVPQDARVFELIAQWTNAKTDTPSALTCEFGCGWDNDPQYVTPGFTIVAGCPVHTLPPSADASQERQA